MCFDHDSHPPIAPIAGAAIDSRSMDLEASDGNRLAAFSADAPQPTGAGIVVLPDVRGLHGFYRELAMRFAEAGVDAIAIDYFGRTAQTADRGEGFDYQPHVAELTWAGVQADVSAAVDRIRADRAPTALFTIGFCMGGRLSFDLGSVATLGLAGVIGFYGPVVGPGRAGSPAPADVAGAMTCPVLGIFGGADSAIPPEAIADYERALSEAEVEHNLVTYPGAPHSFFDRKQAEFGDASAAAWGEVLDFIRTHTPGD
jgi:carboxymethylenebutenolidase